VQTTPEGLATLALLKTRFDQGRDHLELIEPFVADAIHHVQMDAFLPADIVDVAQRRCHLLLPSDAVKTVLGRFARRGQLRREGGRFLDPKLPDPHLDEARTAELERMMALGEALVRYAKGIGHDLDKPTALAALANFIALNKVPLVLRLLALPPGVRVLEVGAGRGVALPVLARLLRPARLVGLDIDPMLIAIAAERCGNRGCTAELFCSDIRELPFADGSFDLIIDFGTCHHIRAPDRALREIERVLSPDGWFVCETVCSQVLSHPFRTRGRRLPWRVVPRLRVERQAFLWKARRKVCPRR